jgi:hypothetical protein
VYTNDPDWQGYIEEFNIYDGTMTAATVTSQMDALVYSNSLLDSITLSAGILEPDFNSDTLTYSVTLPYGITSVTPSALKAYSGETVAGDEAVNGSSGSGGSRITVTSSNSSSTTTYTINYTVAAPSTDATLADLQADGATVEGFDAGTVSYDIELPYGTTEVPEVTATLSDTNAAMVITEATGLPGSTTVEVTAEDGATSKTYTINFTAYTPSSDATLSDLLINETTIDGFASGTYTYDVNLAAGTTEVPAVTATTTDANAKAEVTDATGLPGSTTVEVTAENGTTTLTYTINFTVTTALTDVENNLIQVYPTITRGDITIQSGMDETTVKVFDITGQMVHTQTGYSSRQVINIPKPGMYVVRVEGGDNVISYRVFRTK